MSTQEKHTAKSKTKKAVAASAPAVPPSVYPTEHPKIELDRDLLGYDETGSALVGEELLVDELATATTEAVKEAGKASRKAMKKAGKKAGEAIDAALEKEAHPNPLADLVRAVLLRLRGKGEHYGNSKQDFARFIKENRKSIVGIASLVCGVLVVISAAVWYVSNDNRYALDASAVQYYVGQEYPIDDGAVLVRSVIDDTTKTTLVTDSGDRTLTSLVIYQPSSESIVLTQDMVYYDPRSTVKAQVKALTEVVCTSTSITAYSGNDSATLSRGFLYDGKDYFVFLEEVVVSYNGYTKTLSPLSYIEAVYQNYIVIFDYETKECIYGDITTSVYVTTATNEYTVRLINDNVTYSNGNQALLFTQPDMLTSIFDM